MQSIHYFLSLYTYESHFLYHNESFCHREVPQKEAEANPEGPPVENGEH